MWRGHQFWCSLHYWYRRFNTFSWDGPPKDWVWCYYLQYGQSRQGTCMRSDHRQGRSNESYTERDGAGRTEVWWSVIPWKSCLYVLWSRSRHTGRTRGLSESPKRRAESCERPYRSFSRDCFGGVQIVYSIEVPGSAHIYKNLSAGWNRTELWTNVVWWWIRNTYFYFGGSLGQHKPHCAGSRGYGCRAGHHIQR